MYRYIIIALRRGYKVKLPISVAKVHAGSLRHMRHMAFWIAQMHAYIHAAYMWIACE